MLAGDCGAFSFSLQNERVDVQQIRPRSRLCFFTEFFRVSHEY